MIFDLVLTPIRENLTWSNGLALLLLWVTVIASVVITYFRSSQNLRYHILPLGTLRHPSARADFWFWVARRVTKPLYLFPAALTAAGTGSLMHTVLARSFHSGGFAASSGGPVDALGFSH